MKIKAVNLRKILVLFTKLGAQTISTNLSITKFFGHGIVVQHNDEGEGIFSGDLTEDPIISTVMVSELLAEINQSVFKNTETFDLNVSADSWSISDESFSYTVPTVSKLLGVGETSYKELKNLTVSASISENVFREIASTYLLSIQRGYSVLEFSPLEYPKFLNDFPQTKSVGTFNVYAEDHAQIMQVSTDCKFTSWDLQHIPRISIPTSVLRSLLCLLGKNTPSRHIGGELKIYRSVDFWGDPEIVVHLEINDNGKTAPSFSFIWSVDTTDGEEIANNFNLEFDSKSQQPTLSKLDLSTAFKKLFKGKNLPEFIVEDRDFDKNSSDQLTTYKFSKALNLDNLKNFEYYSRQGAYTDSLDKELVVNTHVFMRTLVILYKALNIDTVYLRIPNGNELWNIWGYGSQYFGHNTNVTILTHKIDL